MKLILLDFSAELHYGIAKKLVEAGFDIRYWVCKDNLIRENKDFKKLFSKTEMHNSFDALANFAPKDYKVGEKIQVPNEIIKKMESYEAQILAMMEKLDNTQLIFAQKRQRFYEYINYWYKVFVTEEDEKNS